MSQLKLKQILEFLSTSPLNGEVLAYNSSTGKYENTALPNTFGLPYAYHLPAAGSVSSGYLRFDSHNTPSQVTISETDLKGSPAATSLGAMTLSTNNIKSIIVIASATNGNVFKSFYVTGVTLGSGQRTFIGTSP